MIMQQAIMTATAGYAERKTSHGHMRHKTGRYLQDSHAVRRRKDNAQGQTVLQRCNLCSACMSYTPLYGTSLLQCQFLPQLQHSSELSHSR